MPATIALVVINVAIFGWLYREYWDNGGQLWYYALLEHGALYNALTLDGEWYRIFTQMFLHGNFVHLAFNMSFLFLIGLYLESYIGTRKYLFVYFITGIAGALASLYFHLFIVGVGASGAIFGLFGYALITDIRRSQEEGRSFMPVIISFVIFFAVNLLLGQTMHADNAAHIGGALCGISLGALGLITKRPSLIVAPILLITYFLLPRFQVQYYNFFQQVLEAQDSTNYVLRNSDKKSDEEFLKEYRHANARWDSALAVLNAQKYYPKNCRATPSSFVGFYDIIKKKATTELPW